MLSSYYAFRSINSAHRVLIQNSAALAVKRAVECALASVLLLIYSPKFLWTRGLTKSVRSLTVYGAQGQSVSLPVYESEDPSCEEDFFDLLRSNKISQVSVLIKVIVGEFSLVGPAPVLTKSETPLYVHWSVRPGLYSAYSLKRQSNILVVDPDYELISYLARAQIKLDLGMLARGILGSFYRNNPAEKPEKLKILDVAIDNEDLQGALNWIRVAACDRSKASQLAFVNPDCLNIAVQKRSYRNALELADRVFADGIGVHLACRMLNLGLRDNLNGTDLFPQLCELAQAESLSLYLLGGSPGVTDQMVLRLKEQYPMLSIAGHRHGFFESTENRSVIDAINESQADILLVALGAPKQDLWIAENRSELRVGLAAGVGGLFDFISQRIPRAPVWMREIGLEWVYRLFQEPGRMWRRYIIGNPRFLYRVYRSKRTYWSNQ